MLLDQSANERIALAICANLFSAKQDHPKEEELLRSALFDYRSQLEERLQEQLQETQLYCMAIPTREHPSIHCVDLALVERDEPLCIVVRPDPISVVDIVSGDEFLCQLLVAARVALRNKMIELTFTQTATRLHPVKEQLDSKLYVAELSTQPIVIDQAMRVGSNPFPIRCELLPGLLLGACLFRDGLATIREPEAVVPVVPIVNQHLNALYAKHGADLYSPQQQAIIAITLLHDASRQVVWDLQSTLCMHQLWVVSGVVLSVPRVYPTIADMPAVAREFIAPSGMPALWPAPPGTTGTGIQIVNCTGADVDIYCVCCNDTPIRNIPRGATRVVLEEQLHPVDLGSGLLPRGVTTVAKTMTLAPGALPAPQVGVFYLVPAPVAALALHRSDLVCADTGPDSVVRDSAGAILGVQRLVTCARAKPALSTPAVESFVDLPLPSPLPMEHGLVNLTPHAVTVYDAEGASQLCTVPPTAGCVLRCNEAVAPDATLTHALGVPVVAKAFQPVKVRLPLLPDGAFYLVSAVVAEHLKPAQRAMVLAPDGGPHGGVFVGGRIVGTRRLVCSSTSNAVSRDADSWARMESVARGMLTWPATVSLCETVCGVLLRLQAMPDSECPDVLKSAYHGDGHVQGAWLRFYRSGMRVFVSPTTVRIHRPSATDIVLQRSLMQLDTFTSMVAKSLHTLCTHK
jgi:hypothetical protein